MLTAKVYEALKSDVEYTRDKTVQYIKAKNMILEYLQINDQITSAKIQEMCGFTKQQARSVIDKMRSEDLIDICRKGKIILCGTLVLRVFFRVDFLKNSKENSKNNLIHRETM